MKSTFVTLLLLFVAVFDVSKAIYDCDSGSVMNEEPPLSSMTKDCADKLKKQIQKEIDASMTYLSMGAFFSTDKQNRPGFAKFFFESASEERHHGMKLIEYLLMRGELTEAVMSLIKPEPPSETNWLNGMSALNTSLALERSVTASIRDVIAACEDTNNNDYHLTDYLSGEFLDEQYKGQRDLAGKISTLKRMQNKNNALGEFLFDKKLLKGELLE